VVNVSVAHRVFAVVAGGLLLAGCGATAASGAHGAGLTARSRSTHPSNEPTASSYSGHAVTVAAGWVGWRHLRLPNYMNIRGIRGDRAPM